MKRGFPLAYYAIDACHETSASPREKPRAPNISPAALFRSVESWTPTLLLNEADSFLCENEELHGLLNGGYTRPSSFVVRVVGEELVPRQFSTRGRGAKGSGFPASPRNPQIA
jgi:hypothetical protein